MSAVCGKVAILVLPESWKGVMEDVRGDYFPNLKEPIAVHNELVEDEERPFFVRGPPEPM
jgi:hypothetical protein